MPGAHAPTASLTTPITRLVLGEWPSTLPSDDLVQISPSPGAVFRTSPASDLPSPGSSRSVLTGQGDTSGSPVKPLRRGGDRRPQPKTASPEDRLHRRTLRPVDVGGRQRRVGVYLHTPHRHFDNAQLIEFDAEGSLKSTAASPTVYGLPLVSSGSRLWASGRGPRCNSPSRVWRINGSNRKATFLMGVHTPYGTLHLRC